MRKLLFLFLSLLTASIANAQNCDKLIVTERNTYPADHYHTGIIHFHLLSELEGKAYAVPRDTISPRKKGERVLTEQVQKNRAIVYATDAPVKAEIFALKFNDSICLELRIQDTLTGTIFTHKGNEYERLQFIFGDMSVDYALRPTKYKNGIRLWLNPEWHEKFKERTLDTNSPLEKIVWYNELPTEQWLKDMKKRKEDRSSTILIGQDRQQLLELTISKPEAEKLRQVLICLAK